MQKEGQEELGNYLTNIKKGLRVEIETKQGKKIQGVVEDVGSRKQHHSLGIMVRLHSGEIGRVKRLLDFKPESKVLQLTRKGENYKLEFKSEALWSLNKTELEIKQSKSLDLHTYRHKASKVILARSIAALLNSEGGNLLIGVRENKNRGAVEITGINIDLDKLREKDKDADLDGYKRMIIDDIIRPYFPPKIYNMLNNYISIEFEELNKKIVCNISIKPSDSKVFLDLEGRKQFMIRTETETRALKDEELVDYCMRRFLR